MWLLPLALVAAFALSSKKVSAAGALPGQDADSIPAGWRELTMSVPAELRSATNAQFPGGPYSASLGTLKPFTYQGQRYGAFLRRSYVATLVPALV